jgi:outer membrane protein OmpA-like peptidoglycan-associated protein
MFVRKGVDEKRITATGKSFHEPIASNTTEEDRAKNRRVEIRVKRND